jgi:hypothetical protein
MLVQHLLGRWVIAYVLGAGTAAVVGGARKPLGERLRPMARSVIKGSLVAGREVRRLAEEANATLGDLVAEAREEIEPKEEPPPEDEIIPSV